MIQTGDSAGFPQVGGSAVRSLCHEKMRDLDRDLPLQHCVIG